MRTGTTLSREVEDRMAARGVVRARWQAPLWLAVALAVVVVPAGLWTYLDPSLLRGTAAMNGSARGTALVAVVVVVPVLLGSAALTVRGSGLAVLTWLGSLGFLLYNGLMMVFATPFNPAFLLYVAWLGLALWSIGTLVVSVDVAALANRFSSRAPVSAIAVYIWTVASLNALLWLSAIVPALGADRPGFLRGTGLPTNVVYVQDLALWLPLMAVAGGWLWRRRPWGYLVAGSGLVLWVLESISVAVDQAFGAAADPTSPVASAAMTPAFAALTVIGLVPIAFLVKDFDGEGLVTKARRLAPTPAKRTFASWTLLATSIFVGLSALYGGILLVHNGFGMPKSWLEGTPFASWAVPGAALVVTVAVPQLAVSLVMAFAPAWARLTGLLAGAALVGWILLQLLVLQRFFFLQPLIAAFGLIEIGCAYVWGFSLHAPPASDSSLSGPNGPSGPSDRVLDLR